MLNWRPLFTLQEGLASTVAWYTEFLTQPNRTHDFGVKHDRSSLD